jgi:FtsP/CotA-like multicopper oxidase with cupredoxin domain
MIDHSRRAAVTSLGLCLLASQRWARGAPAGGPDHDPASSAPFARALRRPGASGLLAQLRLAQPVELTARVDTLPVFSGRATNVWNFATTIDGKHAHDPLLIARRGQRVEATLVNRIGQDTTIHWHGLGNDEANDGSGLHPVRHGERYRYAYEVRNRAGLYWYHAHPHFHTGEQIHHGLASLLLVEDDEELALRERLGIPWGERDIPLLLADKQLGRNNEIAYKAGADDWIGNRVLVNWTPEPHLDVDRAAYRLRVANVSNARMFKLAFVHGTTLLGHHLLGTDGGLLERPLALTQLYLAPAQRADLLLDLSSLRTGDVVRVRSLAYDPMENDAAAAGEDPMLEHPGAAPMGARMDLMELRVTANRPARTALPSSIAAPLPAMAAKPAATRTFRIRISDRGRWMINDWNFLLAPHAHAPAFTVRRGDHEVWELVNEFRSMPHPIHLHGFPFRVVDRRNSPSQLRALVVASHGRTAQDLGLLDTVVVWPGERVRIAIDFAQPYTGTQTYMLHCHNLEHEDQGMMVAFAVVD